jgi:hypothetical protein
VKRLKLSKERSIQGLTNSITRFARQLLVWISIGSQFMVFLIQAKKIR